MTGLYASCGFTECIPELDTWQDKHMSCVTDMDPLTSESYEWCANRRHAISLRLVWGCSSVDECLSTASHRLTYGFRTHR